MSSVEKKEAAIAEAQQKIEERKAKVKNLLGSDALGALKASLEDPPKVSDLDTKRKSAEVVGEVLYKNTDKDDIEKLINGLNTKEQDILMQYLYRSMEAAHIITNNDWKQYNSAILFRWHATLLSIAGVGSIVRTISNKKSA